MLFHDLASVTRPEVKSELYVKLRGKYNIVPLLAALTARNINRTSNHIHILKTSRGPNDKIED